MNFLKFLKNIFNDFVKSEYFKPVAKGFLSWLLSTSVLLSFKNFLALNPTINMILLSMLVLTIILVVLYSEYLNKQIESNQTDKVNKQEEINTLNAQLKRYTSLEFKYDVLWDCNNVPYCPRCRCFLKIASNKHDPNFYCPNCSNIIFPHDKNDNYINPLDLIRSARMRE